MNSKQAHWIVGLAGLALPLLALASGGGSMNGGSMGGGSMPESRPQSPEEVARNAYNDGVRAVKQAKKSEEELAEAKEDKRAKIAERLQKQYEKARSYFSTAVSKKDTMYEAWNYVGYTSRKLGEYDKALAAYDEALRLKPDYAEAIEYRGEAYLWMNRLEDAKQAYMTLFKDQRQMANELMTAMAQWVKARSADAAGVAAGDIDNFAKWVSERGAIAEQTASLATDVPHKSIWED